VTIPLTSIAPTTSTSNQHPIQLSPHPLPNSYLTNPPFPFSPLDLRAKPDPESISKLHAKLLEASAIYSKDKETLSWFVMQSVHDKQDFTIVERYERESSQEYHLNNPYWKTFDPYVIPLLEREMDLRRFEELESEN
jgi:quinol monooxygenase YgiN